MPELKIGERTIPYIIRKSKRARYVSFRVDFDGLQVVMPLGVTVTNLEEVLYEKSTWILRSLREFENKRAQEKQLVSGETLLFFGEPHELEIIPVKAAKRTTVARQGHYLRVRTPAASEGEAQKKEVRAALERWFRRQAKEYLEERAVELADEFGFVFGRVTIKGQRTRWGSCSSNGNLNFNWRLMMAPPGAIDYVIVHELCHLIELNHSAQFWMLVEQRCPAYKSWKRWLEDHHAEMVF